MKAVTLLLALMISVFSLPTIADADKPDITGFAELPMFKSVALSPDGTKIVALRAINGVYHAVLFDLARQSSRLLIASDPKEFHFDQCSFANNERVLCAFRVYGKLIASNIGMGSRWYKDGRVVFQRLFAINADGSNLLQLVEPAVGSPGKDLEWNMPNQAHIVSLLRGDDQHILIQLVREHHLYSSVYKLNIYTNEMSKERRFREPIFNWFADDDGALLMASGRLSASQGVAYSLLDGWNEIDLSANHGLNAPEPLVSAGDGRSLWVAANNGKNTVGIYRYDLRDHKISQELYSNPAYDVDKVVLHPMDHHPLYSEYFADRYAVHWYDDDLRVTYDAVSTALPGKPSLVRILSFDRALTRLVFYSEGNGTLPSWYVYDTKTKSLSMMASSFKNAAPLIDVTPVQYPARDGQLIPAYLALPGPVDKGPYPTIIYPHGGPYARETDRFDPFTQLFVSRGYAVLKPNFRGSSGYGDRYMAAGFDQWGLRMQDDVIDGLDWMIKQGYTDAKRTCIYGASYGGYSALVAAYKTPDKFRCAISFAGVTDLDELDFQSRAYVFGRMMIGRIQEGESRAANSPLKHADEFGVPVLIVQGTLDRTVMPEHAQLLVDALNKAAKPYVYIEQENGDHHLQTLAQRKELLAAIDSFLARHLQ